MKPVRSATTPEDAKRLGLPWVGRVFPHESFDLACAACTHTALTQLCPAETP